MVPMGAKRSMRVIAHGPLRDSTIPGMDEMNARVAAVVRSQAGVKGWSTNRLASEAGEPTPNVRRYFWTGERPIPLEALEKVATAFGWSLSELFLKAEATDPEPFVEPRPRSAKGEPEAAKRPRVPVSVSVGKGKAKKSRMSLPPVGGR